MVVSVMVCCISESTRSQMSAAEFMAPSFSLSGQRATANKAHGGMDLLGRVGTVDKKSVYYSRFLPSWQAGLFFLFFLRRVKKGASRGLVGAERGLSQGATVVVKMPSANGVGRTGAPFSTAGNCVAKAARNRLTPQPRRSPLRLPPRPPFTQGGHRCYLSLPCVRGGQSRLCRDRRGRRGRLVRLLPQNDTRPAHRRSRQRQRMGGVVLPGICGLGPSQRKAPSAPPTSWAAGDDFHSPSGVVEFASI